MLSVTVADSPAQTRAVMLAHALGRPTGRDRREWHALQEWLAAGAHEVSIPYAASLAEAIPPVAVRLRRDFATVVALIQAHALLHRRQRGRDEDGRILANFDDYAVVQALVSDLVAGAADRSIPEGVRETVRTLGDLAAAHDPLDDGLSAARIAEATGVDKSTALRRVRVAIARGFIRNLEERRGRPARLVIGDPMPDDTEILPSAAELERLHGCAVTAGDDVPVELDYPKAAWGDDDSLVEPLGIGSPRDPGEVS
jgi:hypothetical protein